MRELGYVLGQIALLVYTYRCISKHACRVQARSVLQRCRDFAGYMSIIIITKRESERSSSDVK